MPKLMACLAIIKTKTRQHEADAAEKKEQTEMDGGVEKETGTEHPNKFSDKTKKRGQSKAKCII